MLIGGYHDHDKAIVIDQYNRLGHMVRWDVGDLGRIEAGQRKGVLDYRVINFLPVKKLLYG